MLGIHHPFLVTTRDEHQGAIKGIHIIQKDRHVHRALSRHQIIIEPRAVILMPLPHIALKRHLAVDFELVHVKLFTKQIFHRLDHPRVAR